MGSAAEYRCPKCGYSKMVSGGRSCGFYVIVETISCRDCQELFDAEADEKPGDLKPSEMWGKQKLAGIRCPNSDSHEFTYWKPPWPCPVCDEPMIADGDVIRWD